MTRTLDELKELGRKIEAILRAVNPEEAQTVESRFETIERAHLLARLLLRLELPFMSVHDFSNARDFVAATEKLQDTFAEDEAFVAAFEAFKELDEEDLQELYASVSDTRYHGNAEWQLPLHINSRVELRELMMSAPAEALATVFEIDDDGDVPVLVSWEEGSQWTYLRSYEGWVTQLRVSPGDPRLVQEIVRELPRVLGAGDEGVAVPDPGLGGS